MRIQALKRLALAALIAAAMLFSGSAFAERRKFSAADAVLNGGFPGTVTAIVGGVAIGGAMGIVDVAVHDVSVSVASPQVLKGLWMGVLASPSAGFIGAACHAAFQLKQIKSNKG